MEKNKAEKPDSEGIFIAQPGADEKYTNPPGGKSGATALKITLPEVSKKAIMVHFGKLGKVSTFKDLASSYKVTDNYKVRAGLFVTLVKDGKTRACWGSLTPDHRNLIEATIYTTEDALIKDYRYKPISADEIDDLKPQVTVIRKLVPITSISSQKPLRFGLMVRSGGRAAVLLPGEASDAYYQMVKCKLKAGIPVREKCELYRIEADVYR